MISNTVTLVLSDRITLYLVSRKFMLTTSNTKHSLSNAQTKKLASGWLSALAHLLNRPRLALRYWQFRRRYGKLALEKIDGVPLLVLPEVFNPVITLTGEFMARALTTFSIIPPAAQKAVEVLDLGTGSGVGAIFAARLGAVVKAVDINPEAIRCARLNALLNRLEDKIEVYYGDLFEPVAGQQFDLILFNPPFYRGQARDNLDYAWRGEDIFERFSAQLGGMLKPNGQAIIVLSSLGACDDLLQQLRANGFEIETITQMQLLREIITLYCLRSRP